MAQEKAVAKQSNTALAIMAPQAEQAVAAVKEALGSDPLTLSMLGVIKMPTGGGKYWDTPIGPRDTVEGVVVHSQVVRAYWEKSIDETGGGDPPDCYAQDGQNGAGAPGGECGRCPFSAWESDPRGGGGQACSQITYQFVLTAESGVLPWAIRLSPSNHAVAQAYRIEQAKIASHYSKVLTSIGLEPAKSGGGVAYSRATFKRVRGLNDAELESIEKYRTEMLGHLKALLARREAASPPAAAAE